MDSTERQTNPSEKPHPKHERVHAHIRGKVQGVSFRWFTLRTANFLGLRGWVRNLSDGRVELMAEGDKNKLEQLLAWCQRGPNLAVVQEINAEFEAATGEFTDFSIRRD